MFEQSHSALYIVSQHLPNSPGNKMSAFTQTLPASPLPSIVVCLSNYNPERRKQPREAPALRKKKVGNRVLVVGRQRERALYRAEFLRLAGYNVDTPKM
jgi:hypothetical protein